MVALALQGAAWHRRPSAPEGPWATPSDHAGSSWSSSLVGSIGDELEQRAVGIAKIDAGAGPLGTETLDRAGVDRNAVAPEMRHRVADRTVPLEAEVAIARLHRQSRHLGRRKARPVQIELHRAEPVGPSPRTPHQFGAKDVAIKR